MNINWSLKIHMFFCRRGRNSFDLNSYQIILATGGYDHTIKLWRPETKDCIKSMQHADSVRHA